EALVPVLDEREAREDRREQEDHPEDAWEEIGLVLLVTGTFGMERASESEAEHGPEDQGGSEHADDAAALQEEADDLAAQERHSGVDPVAVHAAPPSRRPVFFRKTSSSVGRPTRTDRTSAPNAVTRSGTKCA